MKIAPRLLSAITLALLLPCSEPGKAQTQSGPAKTTRQQSPKIKAGQKDTLNTVKQDSLQPKRQRHNPKYCPGCGMG